MRPALPLFELGKPALGRRDVLRLSLELRAVANHATESLTVARKTIENFLERALRLYEQEPGGAMGLPTA